MTPQEILASLSELESELNAVASARLLVEQTANSYKELQKELRSFIGEFQNVISSLNMVATAIQGCEASIATEVTRSIEVLKAQLETLNISFTNRCNSTISRFIDSINNASDQFQVKTVRLTSDYAANNEAFKNSIRELATIHTSLLKASESVSSLKSDISTLQSQLQLSQKDQDKTLEKIAVDLQTSTTSHAAILQQISNDLKSLQDAQEEDLALIKENISSIASKQIEHEVKVTQAISEFEEIKTKLDSISAAGSSVKMLAILNVAAVIAVIILLFVK